MDKNLDLLYHNHGCQLPTRTQTVINMYVVSFLFKKIIKCERIGDEGAEKGSSHAGGRAKHDEFWGFC